MGKENFAAFKVTELVGVNKIKIIPEILITGGEGGSGKAMDGLLAMKLMEHMEIKKEIPEVKGEQEGKSKGDSKK